jgi:hypothetical protein
MKGLNNKKKKKKKRRTIEDLGKSEELKVGYESMNEYNKKKNK